MKRALVTGGTGFIGRHTLPELVARGFEVHVAGRSKPSADFPSDVTFHECDLLDTGAASLLTARLAPTHLLHLGWYAKPGLFWTSLENLRWVAASLNLYLAFAKAGGTRAVMAGSCAEYRLVLHRAGRGIDAAGAANTLRPVQACAARITRTGGTSDVRADGLGPRLLSLRTP